MSKAKNNDQSIDEQTDLDQSASDNADGNTGDKNTGDEKLVLTIEEHHRICGIDDAVFQAVIQYKGWAIGKKVSQAVFQEAVKAFLCAPMGGD